CERGRVGHDPLSRVKSASECPSSLADFVILSSMSCVDECRRRPSVLGRDGALDDVRFLREHLREMLADVVIGPSLVVEHAERGAFPFTGIEPVVVLESLGLPDNRNEFIAYRTIDRGAVGFVEVVVANHRKHRLPPRNEEDADYVALCYASN